MGKDLGHSKKSEETSTTFEPMRLVSITPDLNHDNFKLTASTTLKGAAARDFEKMCGEAHINRSQLLTQMVYHCLGRSSELKDFYKRLAILGK